MRKLLIALIFASVSVASVAQDSDATEKYSVATNSFWSNWFIQAGADWSVWYGSYEDGMEFSKSPFKKFRANPSMSLSIGKWFTPGIGLRTKVQGIWGKAVFSEDSEENENKYWMVNEHVMFNLSNMLCGYNPDRVYSFIPFAGAGIGRSMTYNRYSFGLSVGILNQFSVSRKVAINFELGWNYYENDICGMPEGVDRGVMSHPNNVYAEIGLTYNLGKAKWNKVPDVDAIKALSQSQIDALNAQLADEKAENERLKNELANKKEPSAKVEKEFFTTPVSVFFNINKSKIASKKDLVNVKSLAEYAKENNATIVVTGYADSATGPADYNRALSQKRAEKVVDELVKMGVDRENIEIKAMGGVSTLVPPSYNRRATVEIAK